MVSSFYKLCLKILLRFYDNFQDSFKTCYDSMTSIHYNKKTLALNGAYVE